MMLLRLALFIIAYIILAGSTVGIIYLVAKPIVHRLRSNKIDYLHGISNAKRLESAVIYNCVACDKVINPKKDAYDPKHGWFHARCYSKCLRGE